MITPNAIMPLERTIVSKMPNGVSRGAMRRNNNNLQRRGNASLKLGLLVNVITRSGRTG